MSHPDHPRYRIKPQEAEFAASLQDERGRIERALGARFSPDFGTEEEVRIYLAEHGQTLEDHEHLLVRWDAWSDWGWNPHGAGKSVMFVCNIPGCMSIWTVPVDAVA